MPQTGFDIDDVVSAFGASYTKGGPLWTDIQKDYFDILKAKQYFRNVRSEETVYKAVLATPNSVLQPFVKAFTPKGSVNFAPHSIEQGRMKMDVLIEPDDFFDSYLQRLAEIEKVDRSKWSVIRHIFNLLLTKAIEEEELEAMFWGWKITGYDGTPTVDWGSTTREFSSESSAKPANGSYDGLLVQFLKVHARLNVVSTGALSTDPVTLCNQVETFFESIPRKYRRFIPYVFMAESHMLIYREGRRQKYNLQYAQANDLDGIKQFGGVKVAYLPGMDGSDTIFATPKDNLLRVYHAENKGTVDVQKVDRSVKLLSDYRAAYGFETPEFIWKNDAETSITAQMITDHYTE